MQVLGELFDGKRLLPSRRLAVSARIERNDALVMAEICDLMLKIIAALAVAVEQNQRLTLALFYVMQLDVVHGFINRLRSSSENFSMA